MALPPLSFLVSRGSSNVLKTDRISATMARLRSDASRAVGMTGATVVSSRARAEPAASCSWATSESEWITGTPASDRGLWETSRGSRFALGNSGKGGRPTAP